MKVFRIGFDLDDVVFDFNGAFLKVYNKEFNDNKTIEDIKSWDMHKYLKADAKQIKELFKTEGLYENLQPYPYMIELVKALKESKIYEPFFISASPEGCYDAKVISIRKNFPFLTKENVIFAHDKSLVDVHILFDDGPHNIINVSDKRKGLTVPVIVERPWNADFKSMCAHDICSAKDSVDVVYFMYCVDTYLKNLYPLIREKDKDSEFKWMYSYLTRDIRQCMINKEQSLFKFYQARDIPVYKMWEEIGEWYK